MADNVKFEDYTIKVINAMNDKAVAELEACAGEIKSQTQRNSRVKSGKTRNSFQHKVIDSELVAYIGSNDENAIWEEFGTGEYALNGDGRKGGWSYVDEKGNGHFTYGKTPSRAFWKAYEQLKNKIITRIQNSFKEL